MKGCNCEGTIQTAGKGTGLPPALCTIFVLFLSLSVPFPFHRRPSSRNCCETKITLA